jgi:hypothetical protein
MLAGVTDMGVSPGEFSLTDHGFVPKFLDALGEKVFDGYPADQTLIAIFEDILTGLDDPSGAVPPVNTKILSLEAGRFLTAPQSLLIRWNPSPNYPSAALDRTGVKLSELLLAANSENFPILAEKIKYVMISELDLSVEVNGRAPVAVVLGPATGPLP